MLPALLLTIGLVAAPADDAQLQRFEYNRIEMAMPFKLVFYAPDQATANRAAEACFARVEQLNSLLSDYDPDSELCRLSDTAPSPEPVHVGDDLWTVLAYAKHLSEISDGTFDITVGPLVRLWRRARRQRQLPPADQLAAAREAVGYQAMQLDPEKHTVRLLKPHMQLDLGGIAAGYACDETYKVLKNLGITRALVDSSGDILVGDPPPGKEGWRIGIGALEDEHGIDRYLILANAAVTTSGDAEQFVEVNGVRYSHIVDPHTGLGLTDHSSVTLIGPVCILADSYTKAVSVLGPKKGLELIDNTPGAAVLVTRKINGKIETYESRRIKDFKWEKP